MKRAVKERVGEWVYMQGNIIRCSRCGRKHRIDLPLVIAAFVKIANGYIEQHRFCKEEKP